MRLACAQCSKFSTLGGCRGKVVRETCIAFSLSRGKDLRQYLSLTPRHGDRRGEAKALCFAGQPRATLTFPAH